MENKQPKYVAIPEEIFDAIIAFLTKQPYNVVGEFIPALKNAARTVDVKQTPTLPVAEPQKKDEEKVEQKPVKQKS